MLKWTAGTFLKFKSIFQVLTLEFLHNPLSPMLFPCVSILQGSIVERDVVVLDESDLADGFFPLKCLVAGVSWPPSVDPTRREQYLHPEEFEETFGMTKVLSQYDYLDGYIADWLGVCDLLH